MATESWTSVLRNGARATDEGSGAPGSCKTFVVVAVAAAWRDIGAAAVRRSVWCRYVSAAAKNR